MSHFLLKTWPRFAAAWSLLRKSRAGAPVFLPALTLALVLLTGLARAAESPLSLDFEEANKLYAQGNYSEAAAIYRRLTGGKQITPALLYNEGNAWFKAGATGRAIAAYQKALTYDPRDPDALANLQFARARVAAPTQPPGRLARAFARLTVNEWTALACVPGWVCFALLAAGEFYAAARSRLRRYALWAGGATLVMLLCLGVALHFARAPRVVVIAREAVVRSSPFEEASSVFTVSDGAELPVLDTKDAWLQISDGRSRTGWLKADAVVRLEQP